MRKILALGGAFRRRHPVLALVAAAALAQQTALAETSVHAQAMRWSELGLPPASERGVEEQCLALNIYHEARGESVAGMLAVAAVTVNRRADRAFPNRICEVVWQPGQFSWTRDGRSNVPTDRSAWRKALALARLALSAPEEARRRSRVSRSVYFHAAGVKPAWAEIFREVARVGRHVFYEPAERRTDRRRTVDTEHRSG